MFLLARIRGKPHYAQRQGPFGVTDATSLGVRFLAFLRSHPDAELIDELPDTDPASLSPGESRADFFLEKRRFLGELKSLETDTRYKIDAILAPHLKRRDWPQFFGTWPLERVLKTLPDGENIFRQVSSEVTSAIPGLVRKANSQIASTKSAIGATSGEGILVVLNDGIELLPPQTVVSHIQRALTERKPDGSARFRHIQSAVVISEAHRVVPGGDPRGVPPFHPLFSCKNRLVPPTKECSETVTELLVGWARFNGKPLAVLQGALPTVMTVSEVTAAQGPIPRHEAWRLDYRAKRTLATLTFDELIAHGRSNMNELDPHFLKNPGRKPPEPVPLERLRIWTEFLEEVDLRGIPTSEWGPLVVGDLGGERGAKKGDSNEH